MKTRTNYHKNKYNEDIAINVPHNIYLKVPINTRHITRTFAKVYDDRSKGFIT